MTVADTIQQLRDLQVYYERVGPPQRTAMAGVSYVCAASVPLDLWPLALDVIDAADKFADTTDLSPLTIDTAEAATCWDSLCHALAAFLEAAEKETTPKGDNAT